MKTLIKLCIVALASVLLLTACGGGGNPPNATPPNQTEDNLDTDIPEVDQEDLAPTEDEQEAEEYTVTLYFPDNELMQLYREERTITVVDEAELPKAALQAWITGPEHSELNGIIPADVIVEYVEAKDGIAYVSFSKEIQNANLGSSGELFLIESVAMIMEQFGYANTQLLVEDQVEESLLGHVTTNEPIAAGNPDEYELKK